MSRADKVIFTAKKVLCNKNEMLRSSDKNLIFRAENVLSSAMPNRDILFWKRVFCALQRKRVIMRYLLPNIGYSTENMISSAEKVLSTVKNVNLCNDLCFEYNNFK